MEKYANFYRNHIFETVNNMATMRKRCATVGFTKGVQWNGGARHVTVGKKTDYMQVYILYIRQYF